MNILGIGFLSEASAAILKDGKLIAAISEERLNRIKQWNGMPHLAIAEVLKLAGLKLSDIDVIATHGLAPARPEKAPFDDKAEIIKRSALTRAQKSRQLKFLEERFSHETKVLSQRTPAYLKEIKALGRPVQIFPHHASHAASTFYATNWNESLVLTADGWGEDGSASLSWGSGSQIKRYAYSYTFDSLGYFYGSITKTLGFTPHRHEGKVLGLAAHCKHPKSYKEIRKMVDYDPKTKRFIGHMENGLYLPRFENPMLVEFAKGFSREDIAASAQKTLEEVVCACIADQGKKAANVTLAGGIFSNVHLNQRIRELPNVKQVYVFPNMGDGGLSVGAAFLAYVAKTGKRPEPISLLYLGPKPSDTEIESELKKSGLPYTKEKNIAKKVGQLLAEGHIVARCEGRMEFGPRALGNRSILYHATDASVNQWLNERLHRSEFMPFAPVTLAEYAKDCYVGFKKDQIPAQHMTMTYTCTPKMQRQSPAANLRQVKPWPTTIGSTPQYRDMLYIKSVYALLSQSSGVSWANQALNPQSSLPIEGPTPTPSPIVATPDQNADGRVNMFDAVYLIKNWGTTTYPLGDLNNNGLIDANDLMLLIRSWK